MPIIATGVVVDPIAVADVQAALGAVTPDRALHEPRKRRRENRIELPSIDLRRQQAENAGAPSRLVASVPVRVVGTEAAQNPGPVQEIMDQRVDCHEARTYFEPRWPSLACA